MKPHPGWGVLLASLLRTVEVAGVLVGIGWIVSRLENGSASLGLLDLLAVLGPICCAAGVALALAARRARGVWSSWAALGFSPRSQLWPLVVLGLLGGVVQVGLGDAASQALEAVSLPAPVSPEARSWPGVESSQAELMVAWQQPPGSLPLAELLERTRMTPLPGARIGVDRAELVRRFGWVLAWPFAIGLGVLAGLRVPSSGRSGGGWTELGAAVCAGAAVAAWALLCLGLSAALARTVA
ncbi:MAG: hypothetical protein VX498_02840 [Myxococcota bacterium]|nr:hypothetical protein [Myxococcota bacterium]